MKKGLGERKAQGLYCGCLPFGVIKGEDGVPVPDPASFPDLQVAFEQAAQGKTDRQIAQYLNSKGHRTAGSNGNKSFGNTTVKGILNNHFYLGYLPDGKGGYIQAKHKPFIEQQIWDAAQETRKRNRTSTHAKCPIAKKPNTLTGIAYCWYCKGRIHTQYHYQGHIIDDQIIQLVGAIELGPRWLEEVLAIISLKDEVHRVKDQRLAVIEKQRRMGKAYVDGLFPDGEYQRQKKLLELELESLVVPAANAAEEAGNLIINLRKLWAEATTEEQRKLLLTMLDAVYVDAKQTKSIVAIRPKPPFKPIFQVAATREGSNIRIINEPIQGSPVFAVETGETLTPQETQNIRKWVDSDFEIKPLSNAKLNISMC